jgi:hypothetical protein
MIERIPSLIKLPGNRPGVKQHSQRLRDGGRHTEHAMRDGRRPEHPMTLLRKAYGI